MVKFFAPNIDRRGRVVRASGGLALIVGGLVISKPGRWTCSALVVVGGFMLYEAVRGWCLMRACGIKTKL